jgi:hypothetical protein
MGRIFQKVLNKAPFLLVIPYFCNQFHEAQARAVAVLHQRKANTMEKNLVSSLKKFGLYAHPVVLSVLAASLLASARAKADNVTDYIGFGIQDRNLYAFTSHSSRILLSSSILSSGDAGNHLATDFENNRLLYTKGLGDGNITRLYAWDFGTNSEVLLYDELNVIGNSSGGASFWNGSYYFYDDESTGSPSAVGVVKITFDENGAVETVSKPFGSINPAEGLGDVAINAAGVMYILSTNGALRSLDLTNETTSPTFTLIGNTGLNGGGQLFFDNIGNLLVRSGANWVIIDPNTAAQAGTIAGGSSAVYADLASAAVIPEPGTVALFGAAGMVFLLFRRRSTR